MPGSGEQPLQKPSSRRGVLAGVAGTIGALLAAGSLWPVWRFLSPKRRRIGAEQVAVPRREISVGGARFFHFLGNPAVLLQPSPGTFIALSAVCTHLGCIVTWRPEERILFCPCHGGRFSTTGEVLGGPPPRPLPRYAVTVEKDDVIVGEGKA